MRGFVYLTVRVVPEMLGQDYFLNVRSVRILLRIAILPNVTYVVVVRLQCHFPKVGFAVFFFIWFSSQMSDVWWLLPSNETGQLIE